jgi:hypothetical protein
LTPIGLFWCKATRCRSGVDRLSAYFFQRARESPSLLILFDQRPVALLLCERQSPDPVDRTHWHCWP